MVVNLSGTFPEHLNGKFAPLYPSASYPILISSGKNKVIAGVYNNEILDLNSLHFNNLDIINGKTTEYIAFKIPQRFNASVKIYTCTGELVSENKINLSEGLNQISVPVSGIAMIRKQ